MEGAKEDKASWVNMLRYLKDRGLTGVRLVISDKCLGWSRAWPSFIPTPAGSAACPFLPQRVDAVPTSKVREVAAMLKAIHHQEDLEAARRRPCWWSPSCAR